MIHTDSCRLYIFSLLSFTNMSRMNESGWFFVLFSVADYEKRFYEIRNRTAQKQQAMHDRCCHCFVVAYI